MKKKVLILAGIPWDTTIQRHHNISWFLEENNYDVYFVEKIPSSNFSFKKLKSALKNRANNKLEVPSKGVKRYKTSFFNPHKGILKKYNKVKTKKIIKEVGNDFDIVITYLPINTTFLFLNEIKYKFLIYDCVRDFTNWGGYSKDIAKIEEELSKKVDLILTDSYYLTNKYKNYKYKTVQILPTIDTESVNILTKAIIKKQIKKIVYFGAVGQHINYNIFNKLSTLDYEVHIIGNVDLDIQEKLSKKIVSHGFVNDLQELSRKIISIADAIIIPYKGDMNGVIPAKLMQCISTGLPIYINEFYDSLALDDLLYIYRDETELVKLLSQYSIGNHYNRNIKMKEYFEKNSKDNKLDVILERINCNGN